MNRDLVLLTAALLIGGCTNTAGDGTSAADNAMPENGAIAADMAAPPASSGGRASLAAADGSVRGSATISEDSSGLNVQVQAEGLPAGVHGVHVHTVGRCDGPKFETAGAHWNPSSRQHGRDNPEGAHAGDLPNIEIAADGRGTLTFAVPTATMAQLFDADGAALLIHAEPDDYRTDPSGKSGDRIACGVIERG